MSWWREFASRIECDAPIGRSTWFRLGGCARFLFRPQDVSQLSSLLVRARQEDVPVKVLGSGANVLVSDDGFDGVVVRLDSEVFRTTNRTADRLDVGAGVGLMPLARLCSEQGLSGLEYLAGIPATVGGAVKMNAGGRLGDLSQVVREIRVLGDDGSVETWDNQRIGFGYRHSELGDRIVLSARLALQPGDPEAVTKTFDECFDYKRRVQPMAERSAGCVFKNPAGESAGALIDRAGLKGTSCGGARVSSRHANFIVVDSGATASDVLGLVERIQERVRRVFDVELALEIEVWRPRRSKGTSV